MPGPIYMYILAAIITSPPITLDIAIAAFIYPVPVVRMITADLVHHLCSVGRSCKSDRGLQWSREGENAYGPVNLRSTRTCCSRGRLHVTVADGGLALAPLLPYTYQTKHGIYVHTSSNLFSIGYYTFHK
jgi:hypothetical protein